MTSALIGYSGFVGSNLLEQFRYTHIYNSKNIQDIRNQTYDLVVCSGIPSAMWMANQKPEEDAARINALLEVLKTIHTDKFVLISSIAVYQHPVIKYDERCTDFENKLAYGKNRRYAEEVIESIFDDYLVVRLPTLFGNNQKKNFIYDLLNPEPAFITTKKWSALLKKINSTEIKTLNNYYGFNNKTTMFEYHKKKAIQDHKRNRIREIFEKADFSALHFTHSKSLFQYYPLKNLQSDITVALDNQIKTLNICSEPVSAREIARDFFGIDFDNDNGSHPFHYNMITRHARLWNKDGNYQYSRDDVYAELQKYFMNK